MLRSHSTKAGTVILVTCRMYSKPGRRRWGSCLSLRRARKDCPAGRQDFAISCLQWAAAQLLPLGSDFLQLMGGALLLCETAAPVRSFQAFRVQLSDWKEGRDGLALLQRGKKEGERASAYHCTLGSAARGDCPMFPKGIGKSAWNAFKTWSAWLGRFVGILV